MFNNIDIYFIEKGLRKNKDKPSQTTSIIDL